MPGSPNKRARREAAARSAALAEAAKELQPAINAEAATQSPAGETVAAATQLAPAVTPLRGEVLSPAGAPEPTRTALKRAMRARAQEHAQAAIAVLVANMNDQKLDATKRADAANKLLEWGFGKPGADIELGDGDQLVVIRKYVGSTDE